MNGRSVFEERALGAYARSLERLPPAERVLLLYDGALRFLDEARRAAEAGAIEARFRASERVRAIVEVLDSALDHERGGAIAAQLAQLYRYVARRLMELNVKNDPEIAAELKGLFKTLREGWARIAHPSPTAPAKPAAAPAQAVRLSA